MSISFKRDNGDLIWFDAVLSFQQQYNSSLTKHPVQSGAVINDHIIIDNPTFNISGVVSAADFNSTRPYISQEDRDAYDIRATDFLGTETVEPVVVAGNLAPNILKFLPETLKQFVGGDTPPTILLPTEKTQNSLDLVRESLLQLNRGVDTTLPNGLIRTVKETFTILEWENGKVKRHLPDCVLTSLSFSEDAESGDALYPVMQIEQAKYVPAVATTIPPDVTAAMKNKAAPKTGKGKQPAKSEGVAATADAKVEPTEAKTETSALKRAGGVGNLLQQQIGGQ